VHAASYLRTFPWLLYISDITLPTVYKYSATVTNDGGTFVTKTMCVCALSAFKNLKINACDTKPKSAA